MGEHIEGLFFFIDYTISTSFILEKRKEYSFKHFYFSTLFIHNEKTTEKFKKLKIIQSAMDIIFKREEFASFIVRDYITNKKQPTTGLSMILTAVALGYKDIYVTGIDFHKAKDGDMYAFSVDKDSNYAKRGHLATEEVLKSHTHTEETEKRLLELVKNMPDVNIYALSDNTELSKIIDLAPIQNDTPYIPEDKPEGYLKDIVFPNTSTNRKGKIQKLKQKFIDEGLSNEWEFLRNNMIVRFFYHLIKMPYILLKIFVKFFIKR